MAYSSVAQAAYALVPLATLTLMFFDQAIFYLIAYLFMTLGAFAVLLIVTRDAESEDLTAFSGLYHRAPWLAVAMTVFLLSLAGLPITGGFFGKFYIFLGSLGAGKYWLAAVMAVTSVISYVYYFSIVRQMYMRPGKEEPLAVPASVAVVVLIAFIGTVGIGFAPQLVLSGIQTYFPNLGEMFIYAPR